jgi:hypothetical protein
MPFTIKKVLSEAEAKRAFSPEQMPDGDYPAVFEAMTETKSKKDKEMLVPCLLVTGPNGPVPVNDYWVDSPRVLLKIRHACASVGVLEALEAGEPLQASMFVGKRCTVRIVTEKSRTFGPRNVIADYLPEASGVVTPLPLRAAG